MTLQKNGITRREFLRLSGGGVVYFCMGGVLSSGCAFIDAVYEDFKFANETDKVYPLTREITKSSSSVEESVKAVVQWSEKNFFHFYEEFGELYGMGNVYGARNSDDLYNNILPNYL